MSICNPTECRRRWKSTMVLQENHDQRRIHISWLFRPLVHSHFLSASFSPYLDRNIRIRFTETSFFFTNNEDTEYIFKRQQLTYSYLVKCVSIYLRTQHIMRFLPLNEILHDTMKYNRFVQYAIQYHILKVSVRIRVVAFTAS